MRMIFVTLAVKAFWNFKSSFQDNHIFDNTKVQFLYNNKINIRANNIASPVLLESTNFSNSENT